MKKITQIIILLLCIKIGAQTSAHPIPTFDKARMELNQNHVNYNPQKGFITCKQAAEEQNPKAMNTLAILYSNGIGTTTNQEQALYWFTKAAEAGYSKAWYNVAIMHREGLGTPQDFEKSFAYFDTGAAQNSVACMFGKAYMLYKGLGCQQSYDQAVPLLQKSSQYGSLGAMYLLGICYRNGYGIAQDLVLAKQWLTKAASYKHQPAINEMMEASPEIGNQPSPNKNTSKKEIITTDTTPFEPITHQIPTTTQLEGTYTGHLITYDWSGQHIIAKTPLTLTLQPQPNGTFIGSWTEDNKTTLALQGTITSTQLQFNNTAYSKTDHYSAKKPTQYIFKTASLKTIADANTTQLAGNLQLWSARLNEPEKPMYISLQKTNQTTPVAQNNNLVVYPNPFENSLSFDLSLQETTTVDVALYALTGSLLYTQKLVLPPGNHTHTLNLNLPQATYLLKVNDGKTSKTALVIKSKN